MRKPFLIGSLLLTAVLIVGLLQFKKTVVPALPVLGSVSDFHLTDSRGQAFSLVDLQDHVWVADFVLTHCQNECPVLSEHMQRLTQRFQKNADVHFFSLSVDPAHETLENLAAYAKGLDADVTRWHFVTGSPDTVKDLMVHGFKIGVSDQVQNHSMYFVLVDKSAHIRGYYDAMDAKAAKQLVRDITRVLHEHTPASGA